MNPATLKIQHGVETKGLRMWAILYVPYNPDAPFTDFDGVKPVAQAELVCVLANNLREANDMGLQIIRALILTRRGFDTRTLEDAVPYRMYRHSSIEVSFLLGKENAEPLPDTPKKESKNFENFIYNFEYVLDKSHATESERAAVGELLARFKQGYGNHQTA